MGTSGKHGSLQSLQGIDIYTAVGLVRHLDALGPAENSQCNPQTAASVPVSELWRTTVHKNPALFSN